jgi:hypothetical protein
MTWNIKVGRPCDEDGGNGNATENPNYKTRWMKGSRKTKTETD